MPTGKNKFDKQHSVYDDAPVDFVISDLPENIVSKKFLFLDEIKRLYRLEAAYRKVFFDAQVRPFDIKAALEKRIEEYRMRKDPSIDVPSSKLWHYTSS